MADKISDAILDAFTEKDPNARVACETVVTTGLVFVTGEIRTEAYVDIQKLSVKQFAILATQEPNMALMLKLVLSLSQSMNNPVIFR